MLMECGSAHWPVRVVVIVVMRPPLAIGRRSVGAHNFEVFGLGAEGAILRRGAERLGLAAIPVLSVFGWLGFQVCDQNLGEKLSLPTIPL